MTTAGAYTAPKNMRAFLIIWVGQLISMLGSGLTSFGLGVWIFQRTGQATPFALTVLFSNLPRILLLPLTGTLADRWNRRWMMLLGDSGSALTTLVVVLLARAEMLDVWHIYIISFFYAIFGAFQEPAYRASIVLLVPKKDLPRANGLLSSSDAITMLVTPLLAGVLFAAVGLSGIILIDFVTYFFALAAMLMVRIPQPPADTALNQSSQKPSVRGDMVFAWGYLRARPGLLWIVFYFALVNFLLNLSAVLTSPLALGFTTVTVMGVIQTVSGLGMLAGSIAVSTWGGPKRRIVGVIGFIAVMAVGLLLIGLRPSPWVTGAGMFLMMVALPFSQASSSAITQSKIAPGVQGRVFAMRSMISQSMMPLAFLSAGPLADLLFNPLLRPGGALDGTLLAQIFGVGPTRGIGLLFAISSVVLLLVSLLAWSSPRIRNVEDELPDVIPDEGEEREFNRDGQDLQDVKEMGQVGEAA